MNIPVERVGGHDLAVPEWVDGEGLVLQAAGDAVMTIGVPTVIHLGFSFCVPAGYRLVAQPHHEIYLRGILALGGSEAAQPGKELTMCLMLAAPLRSPLAPKPILNVSIPKGTKVAVAHLVPIEIANCELVEGHVEGRRHEE